MLRQIIQLILYIFSDIIKIGNLTQSVVTTGCNMKYSWCKTTPQIRLPQYVTGALLFSIGFPLTFLFLNVLYSKVVGPRKQVEWYRLRSAFSTSASF